MDFDWQIPGEDFFGIPHKEIEEAFEDPFSVRMLPDESNTGATRYYLLGRSIGGRYLFCVFWTDGKNYRIVAARNMTQDEQVFYDRKNAESLS